MRSKAYWTPRPEREIFSEHMTGLDFDLDPSLVNVGSADRIRTLLQDAIASLERYRRRPVSPIG